MEGACISANVRRGGSWPTEHCSIATGAATETYPDIIAGHGFWTDPSMGNQMPGEEKLQERSGQGCGWGCKHFASPPSR